MMCQSLVYLCYSLVTIATIASGFAIPGCGDRWPSSLRQPHDIATADSSFPRRPTIYAIAGSLDFDFSSKAGWDTYYKLMHDDDLATEWHSSISTDVIASYIPTLSRHCIMIGCGTSCLPESLLDITNSRSSGNATGLMQLTLLDSSTTCVEYLANKYASNKQIKCIVGDATQLQYDTSHTGDEYEYDLILDKGLLDALLCSEGWNGPVERLFDGAFNLLSRTNGRYILISYHLPRTTQEFLEDIASNSGFGWRFNCTGSNDRVSVSVATAAAQC